jgi:hypothetical protein
MIKSSILSLLLSTLILLGPWKLSAQDSAEVTTVRNRARDWPLAWRFEEDAEIGPALDGPAAFFRVFPWTVASDLHDQIYVLDVGDHRVAVFDQTGQHVRDLGRRGGGPGEFQRPVGVTVTPDGSVFVADAGKGALVRFDSTGGVLDQIRLDIGAGSLGNFSGILLMADGPAPQEQVKLAMLADSATSVVAEVSGVQQVSFPGCRMTVPGRPFFAPVVSWGAAGTTLALNDSPEYRVRVWHGRREAIHVTRDLPPIAITRAAALRAPELRADFTIRWPQGSCTIDPEDQLQARGWARQRSPIDGIAVAPDGRFWVARRTALDAPPRIDVFTSAGEYLGTLPEGAPFPSLFLSDGRPLRVVYTSDGIPYVVVYAVSGN